MRSLAAGSLGEALRAAQSSPGPVTQKGPRSRAFAAMWAWSCDSLGMVGDGMKCGEEEARGMILCVGSDGRAATLHLEERV